MGENSTPSLTDFFDGYIEHFADTNDFISPGIFSTLEGDFTPLVSQKSNSNLQERLEEMLTNSPKRKRPKLSLVVEDGQQKAVSHIAVERNRRKQMNEHLTVLRSLMPCFYVKRGDQASIIGGVVDYITELQQVLQSLESKKQRKVYTDHVLSPRKPPLSPLPISPRTPQPVSPYRSARSYLQPSSSPSSSSSNSVDIVNDLAANSKSSIADVEAKFSGSNLVVTTISPRLPGQATKIVSVLEDLSLEILEAGINTVDETTMVNSFTIKIGIECKLSAEDLVQHIQQTFC